jgi:hypothetical protein
MIAALLYACASCGTGATVLPDDAARIGLPASYSLQSVNGSQLPWLRTSVSGADRGDSP